MAWRIKKQKPALVLVPTQEIKPTIITHSINKYTLPEPIKHQKTPYKKEPLSHSLRNHWTAEKVIQHIKAIQEDGYVKGAEVTTKWGVTGIIDSFITVPPEGLTFHQQPLPNIFTLIQPGRHYQTSVYYNRAEVTLVKSHSESHSC